jgi:hypothetical protein
VDRAHLGLMTVMADFIGSLIIICRQHHQSQIEISPSKNVNAGGSQVLLDIKKRSLAQIEESILRNTVLLLLAPDQ